MQILIVLKVLNLRWLVLYLHHVVFFHAIAMFS